jgi:hypothetical protein
MLAALGTWPAVPGGPARAQEKSTAPARPARATTLTAEEKEILKHKEMLEHLELLQNLEFFLGKKVEKRDDKAKDEKDKEKEKQPAKTATKPK